MSSILQIPEIKALSGQGSLVRIPDQLDVAVTKRILKVIDSAPFQRLQRVSQLGLVRTVYPGATHTRFEHSLGVYRMALLFVQQLATNETFCQSVSDEEATALLLASLLHDIGHYPFCHPIEDLQLPGFIEHEQRANQLILNSELAGVIESEFEIDPQDVIALIERRKRNKAEQLLCSILSGPIDVDKMDYLYRDSLHAGVPYGKNFDALRLIKSLCLNEQGNRLAISAKGRTAAELLVFARYVMFSEVYWHHAVRSATAMLQRIVYELSQDDPSIAQQLSETDEFSFSSKILNFANLPSLGPMVSGLFGNKRQLFKRVATYNRDQNEAIYKRLARRPYPWLVKLSQSFAERLSVESQVEIGATEILIDAPPVALEVQFDVEVYYPDPGRYVPFGTVSPVVRTLAQQQFDELVKQVRIFCAPRVAGAIKGTDIDRLLLLALDSVEAEA